MKILLTEKTKQEKIIEKRNLFGLGLTSLIAACGATDSATDSATDKAPDKTPDNTAENLDKRPTKNLEATQLSDDSNNSVTTADTATIPSNQVGYALGRNDPAINDVQITVAATDRGATSGGGDLVLRIANGNHISSNDRDSPNASVHTGLTAADKHDLVISSRQFGDAAGSKITGAVYIFWDIGNINPTEIPTNNAAVKTLEQAHLKIENSDVVHKIFSDAPEFHHIGGVKDVEADQYDMVFLSFSGYNILWDVTQHAIEDETTTVTLGTSPGILQIQGAGGGAFSFIKVNNNDNYDMIITGSSSTHIVWDIAKYYDDPKAKTDPVLLSDFNTATHGLLTIEAVGDLTSTIKKATTGPDEGGFTDIDGGGTNDIAFEYGSNTYILFGEKVANIKNGKAISHTVNLIEIVRFGHFYDKADEDNRNEVTNPAETGGFFNYDFDGTAGGSDPEVVNVGYRFGRIIDNLTDIVEAYADIA